MLLNEILTRRSIREYKPDEISDEKIQDIIKAAQFAPTANNNRSVEFLIIRDPQIKNEICKLIGQDYLNQAPVLIVPAVDQSASVTPIQDLSIATSFIFLQATNLGFGTVWKNVREEFQHPIKKLLNVPDNFEIINVIPIGYPANPLPPHKDSEFSESKIHSNFW